VVLVLVVVCRSRRRRQWECESGVGGAYLACLSSSADMVSDGGDGGVVWCLPVVVVSAWSHAACTLSEARSVRRILPKGNFIFLEIFSHGENFEFCHQAKFKISLIGFCPDSN
jgi:hypothetical protein